MALGAGPPFFVLAGTIPTEVAPVFAGFEGRGFLLHGLWLVELWTAFAEPAVIESPGAYREVKSNNKIIRFQRTPLTIVDPMDL
jgi:hypothetical protein